MRSPTPLSSCFVLLVALLSVGVVQPTAGFYDWLYFNPPTSMVNMSRIRLGSTFSITGASILPGLANYQSMKVCVQRINEMGGAWYQGKQYAVSMQYINDVSAADLAYTAYQTMTTQVKNTRNNITTVPATVPLDILFAPHTTPMTLPALTAVKTANVSLWAVGASSAAAFPGYPYIWGNTALGDTWLRDPFNLILQKDIKTAAIISRIDAFSLQILAGIKTRFAALGIQILYLSMFPSTIAALDAQTGPWLLTQFQNASFPQEPDILIMCANGQDMWEASKALKTSGRAPKMAMFSQYYEDSDPTMVVDQEGWIGVFPYRYDNNLVATLPGVMFKDGYDFSNYFATVWPDVSIVPSHAQQVGAFEAMLAALNTTASLSSVDLRAANLALDGQSFFSKVKYDPKLGSNPAQQLATYQLQNGRSVKITKTDDIIFPIVWPWTIPVVYTQSTAQKGLSILTYILMVTLVGVFGFFLYVRRSRVLHAASPSLLAIVLVGNAMLLVAAVLTVAVPDKETCAASGWLFNLGFTLSLGSLVLKTFRLNAIFNSKKLTVSNLTDKILLAALSVMVIFDVILLAIRTGVAPYADTPSVQMCEYAASVSTEMRDLSDALSYILIITKGALLLAGAVLCFKTRSLPSLYNESSFLAVCVYNTAVISCIWLVIRYAFSWHSSSNPLALSYVECVAMLIGPIATTLLIFLPKFITIISSGEHKFMMIKNKQGGIKVNNPNASKLETAMNNTTAGPIAGSGSNGISAQGSPSLNTVKVAVDGLIEQLNQRLEKAIKDVLNNTRRVTDAKEEVNNIQQQIAVANAEKLFLNDLGATLTDGQLAKMLQERTSGQSSSDHHQQQYQANQERGSVVGTSLGKQASVGMEVEQIYRKASTLGLETTAAVAAGSNASPSPQASGGKRMPAVSIPSARRSLSHSTGAAPRAPASSVVAEPKDQHEHAIDMTREGEAVELAPVSSRQIFIHVTGDASNVNVAASGDASPLPPPSATIARDEQESAAQTPLPRHDSEEQEDSD